MIRERICDEKTSEKLRYLFDRNTLFANLTPLEIPGIGKLTATSMKFTTVREGRLERYFSFEQEGRRGEISRRGEDYFITYQDVQEEART